MIVTGFKIASGGVMIRAGTDGTDTVTVGTLTVVGVTVTAGTFTTGGVMVRAGIIGAVTVTAGRETVTGSQEDCYGSKSNSYTIDCKGIIHKIWSFVIASTSTLSMVN